MPSADLMAFGVSAIGKVGPSYCQNVRTLDEYYDSLDSGTCCRSTAASS
jgi:oxygen-independent coproporphyrinogen-3 oxidase